MTSERITPTHYLHHYEDYDRNEEHNVETCPCWECKERRLIATPLPIDYAYYDNEDDSHIGSDDWDEHFGGSRRIEPRAS